jgi:hypothetical protein
MLIDARPVQAEGESKQQFLQRNAKEQDITMSTRIRA